jgi:hypothetical protein
LHGKISLIWIVAHELLPPPELFFLLKPDGALERNQSKFALAFSREKWLFLGEKATQLTCFRGTSTLVPLYCAHTGAWRLVRLPETPQRESVSLCADPVGKARVRFDN